MKCFYYSRYRFYKPNIKHETKFFLISDIHFSPSVRSERLSAITEQARKLQPDYTIIAGDLIDSLDAVDTEPKLNRLTAWLEQLGTVAPVFIALGNHDFYLKNPDYSGVFSKKRHWFTQKRHSYLSAISNIPNVTLLDNSSFEDKNAYLFGFTQSPEYFQFDRDDERTTSFFHPGSEDLNILLHDLKNLDPKLISNLPAHKAKIAIVHSPVHLSNPKVAVYFDEFDFIISGHMHSGVVLPGLSDFWKSDRGIVAPGKLLFPRNSRTHITSPNQKNIICGAVSTIQDSAKPITFLNGAFPVNIATLELTHHEPYARKPDIKHEYISFKS